MSVRAGQDPEHLTPIPREGEGRRLDVEPEPRNVQLDLFDEPAVRNGMVACGGIRDGYRCQVGLGGFPATAVKHEIVHVRLSSEFGTFISSASIQSTSLTRSSKHRPFLHRILQRSSSSPWNSIEASSAMCGAIALQIPSASSLCQWSPWKWVTHRHQPSPFCSGST